MAFLSSVCMMAGTIARGSENDGLATDKERTNTFVGISSS